MPMHDRTRVDAGIYHAFHHDWITELARALNGGLLPEEFYALPEQQAAGFGPDVLTLQTQSGNGPAVRGSSGNTATIVQTRPRTHFSAETDAEFYRRKKSTIVVRHVSGDRIVSMLEVISPGNKTGRHALRAFVDKACELLEQRIHLLILDPFPPGRGDPNGIHSAIWAEVHQKPFVLPKNKPLTLVAYECDKTTRAISRPLPLAKGFRICPCLWSRTAMFPCPWKPPIKLHFQACPGAGEPYWKRLCNRKVSEDKWNGELAVCV